MQQYRITGQRMASAAALLGMATASLNGAEAMAQVNDRMVRPAPVTSPQPTAQPVPPTTTKRPAPVQKPATLPVAPTTAYRPAPKPAPVSKPATVSKPPHPTTGGFGGSGGSSGGNSGGSGGFGGSGGSSGGNTGNGGGFGGSGGSSGGNNGGSGSFGGSGGSSGGNNGGSGGFGGSGGSSGGNHGGSGNFGGSGGSVNNQTNWGSGQWDRTIRCESRSYKYRECRVDARGGAKLQRVLGGDCRRSNWGYRSDLIWVNNGCRADFATRGYGQQGNGDSGNSAGWIIGGVAIAAGLAALLASSGKNNETGYPGDVRPARIDVDINAVQRSARSSFQRCLDQAALQIGATGGTAIALEEMRDLTSGNGGYRFSFRLRGTWPDSIRTIDTYCRATSKQVVEFDFS